MAIFERDFVMRLVKQLAELFARALKLKQEKKYDEAGACLESGCLTLFGIDWKTLSWADSASAAQLLKDPARIRAFAELLEQRAELHEAAGEAAEARSKWQHAFEMYREAGEHADTRAGAERTGKKIDVLLLPAKYR